MDPALLELIAAGSPGDEVAVIVRLREGAAPPPDLRLVARFGTIATGRALRGRLAAIHDDPAVASLKAPRIYAGEPAPAPDEPGPSEVDPAPESSDERRPPDLLETGAGTIVAAIDWGLDFAHPDFRDAQGRTRLVGLWDQRVRDVPSPYGYGAIHSREAIDAALTTDNPFEALSYTPATTNAPAHGTHVLGIAAGNGQAGGPMGVAPGADLVFVHLGPGVGDLGNSIDLLEAVHFVVATAGSRPVALNMSIGRHAGPHNGTLLIEQAIDWLITGRPGTVVIQSTGNYFARRTHMEGRLHETRTAILPFTVPALKGQPVIVELWYNAPDTFSACARAPDGSMATAERGSSTPVVDDQGRELARLYHRGSDPNSGDHLISLVLRPDAPAGEWKLEATGVDVVDGRWHAWIERNAICPRCQGQFEADRASGTSTTGSISNALRTIAVGAYDAHSSRPRLAKFSSAGPTRDGRPKPLLVAPGVRVLSARSRLDPAAAPGYVRMSGTSMAAPHVTGTLALMMEAAGAHPVAALRRVLFASLTPAPESDPRWGYGLLDIAAAVDGARHLRAGRQPEAVPLEGAEGARAPPPMFGALLLPTEDTEMSDHSEELPEFEDQYDEGDDRPFGEMFGEAEWLFAEASLEDAEAAIEQAIDPDDPSRAVVAWPGKRLELPLWPGDMIVRRGVGGKPQAAMITSDQLLDRREAQALGSAARAPGSYVTVAGSRIAQRLTGPDGLLLPETVVIRSTDDGEALPAAPRPTARQGSRGPAVSEAQTRLNAVHARRIASGAPGLDRCPLTVDGAFGANTRAAVIAFQRIAFPGAPNEWDGVLGPRSWAALIDANGDGEDKIVLPTRCTRLDERTVIDEFAFGSSDVRLEHQPIIIGIARCVIESQSTSTPVRRLRAIGHTDPVGSDSANVTLGLKRAEAIRKEILGAIHRMTGRPPTLTIDVDSRGEREPGTTPGQSRRVEVLSDFAFVPGKKPPPPAKAATIEFVLDDDNDRRVDGRSPVATALMFGLWDQAYQPPNGAVRNGAAEGDNFVGRDARRFYLRVRDAAARGTTVTVRWRTLTAARINDDAPTSQDVTLTETAPGSKIFVSRALMLVVDNTDASQPTHSGLTTGPDAGVRNRGQSNHRLRRGALDGFVRAEYTPTGGALVSVTLPLFERNPEARLRLPVRVVNWGNHATQARIDAHFAAANTRWAIVGLRIDPGATVDLPIPPACLDGSGSFPNNNTNGGNDSPEEIAAFNQLVPLTPDGTITVVFVRLNGPAAYVTIGRAQSNNAQGRRSLGDRYFVFMDPRGVPGEDTLAHEFHHAIFNRFDFPEDPPGSPNVALRPFFPFNTNPLGSYAPVTPPDVRLHRRVQNLHSPDPDNDPRNDNVINWTRRRRTRRFNTGNPALPPAIDPADPTTGNIVTVRF